ncbi:UNVERIFIED_CONTAM: hypothetical protein FKN15_017899 [Acipenser sinensis]
MGRKSSKKQQQPEDPSSIFPWCTWCREVDHRWRECPDGPPSHWCGRCEEFGHGWPEHPYARPWSSRTKCSGWMKPRPKRYGLKMAWTVVGDAAEWFWAVDHNQVSSTPRRALPSRNEKANRVNHSRPGSCPGTEASNTANSAPLSPLQPRQGFTKPGPQPSAAKSAAQVSLSGRTHVGEERWSETKPRGAVTPTGSWPTLRRGEESGDWHARRSNAAIFLSPEPNLEFGPKSGQSGEDAKAVNHPSMATGKARAHSLTPKKHLIPGLQRTP